MMIKTLLAAGAALLGTAAVAGFDIDIDLNAKPIRDARQTPCASLVGYAGSFNSEKMGPIYDNDAFWYGSNRLETAQAMLDAGAYQQRLWSANRWFARRHPVTDEERQSVTVRRYLVDANLAKVVLDSTTKSGETETVRYLYPERK